MGLASAVRPSGTWRSQPLASCLESLALYQRRQRNYAPSSERDSNDHAMLGACSKICLTSRSLFALPVTKVITRVMFRATSRNSHFLHTFCPVLLLMYEGSAKKATSSALPVHDSAPDQTFGSRTLDADDDVWSHNAWCAFAALLY